jgi:hypothetical protein
VSTEAEELHRIITASVRDMLDAYRIQAQAGPVTDKALEEDPLPGGAWRPAGSRAVSARATGRAAAECRAHAAGDVPRGSGGRGRVAKRGEGGVMRENGLDWAWRAGAVTPCRLAT